MKTEAEIIKQKMEVSLSDLVTKEKTFKDFSKTFYLIGLDQESSDTLAQQIIEVMASPVSLEESERKARDLFKKNIVDGKPFTDRIFEKFTGRAELIYDQVQGYFGDISGKVIDYGAGDGQVTQLLHDNLNLSTDGVDVRDFRASSTTVPIRIFDGHNVPVADEYYEAGLMTNVAHHEKDNEKIIKELTRIIKHRLVLIETVPAGSTVEEVEADRGRTFLNDALWNRYFQNANIPVPGTYETPEGWISRFQKHGWKVIESIDLGIDQPMVQDIHHLLVLEK
jgi:SAM-dependent methyltransferase